MASAGHIVRVIRYGVVLEPLLSLAVRYGDSWFGKTGQLEPPAWMNFAGSGDFEAHGRANVALLHDVAELRPDDQVLEIGCGIGRNAAYLPEALPEGGYCGFDVVRTGIAWCRNRISKRHPRFHFTRVDVRNGLYNPFGRVNPTRFRFPYDDARFTIVFATSVFTHMLWPETDRYLSESHRVLSPAARLLFTAFLLDERAQGEVDRGRAHFSFPATHGRNRVELPHNPNAAVAYTNAQIDELLSSHGFRLKRCHPGSWSGTADAKSFQDVILAIKI